MVRTEAGLVALPLLGFAGSLERSRQTTLERHRGWHPPFISLERWVHHIVRNIRQRRTVRDTAK